jgi:hypothetical protein
MSEDEGIKADIRRRQQREGYLHPGSENPDAWKDEFNDDSDPLGPARGILNGLFIAAALWALLMVVWSVVLSPAARSGIVERVFPRVSE